MIEIMSHDYLEIRSNYEFAVMGLTWEWDTRI